MELSISHSDDHWMHRRYTKWSDVQGRIVRHAGRLLSPACSPSGPPYCIHPLTDSNTSYSKLPQFPRSSLRKRSSSQLKLSSLTWNRFPKNRHVHSPDNSSKHFSCNLPFFGTANNSLSFKLSTSKLIVLSAPKEDLLARLVDGVENLEGRGRLGVAGWESPFPLRI